MQENHIKGRLSSAGHGIGNVTERMMNDRAQDLAAIAGRAGKRPTDADIEQARREMTGEDGLNPAPSPEEMLPEEARWNPVPESTGEAAPRVMPVDEQTLSEQLVEEGIAEAEYDQMREAEKSKPE